MLLSACASQAVRIAPTVQSAGVRDSAAQTSGSWLFVASPKNKGQPTGVALSLAPPFPYPRAHALEGTVDPVAVTVAPAGAYRGYAFVSDQGSGSVLAYAPPYDEAPRFELKPAIGKDPGVPQALASDVSGTVYVAAYDGPQFWNWMIARISPAEPNSPRLDRIFGYPAPYAPYPDILLVDRHQNVLLVSELYSEVYELLAPAYRELRLIAHVQWLRGAALSAGGDLVIEDGATGIVSSYAANAQGVYSRRVGLLKIDSAAWSFACTAQTSPREHGNTLAVDRNGDVFVAVSVRGGNAVAEYERMSSGRYRPKPKVLIPLGDRGNPLALRLDSADNLYVSTDTYPPEGPGILVYAAATHYGKLTRVIERARCGESLAFSP